MRHGNNKTEATDTQSSHQRGSTSEIVSWEAIVILMREVMKNPTISTGKMKNHHHNLLQNILEQMNQEQLQERLLVKL
ncbi:hypothetical protein Hamer_G024824 [Homarus americanus]|uniref:Uncharacterized protein n=1 Tax=Homarus americanus TaxID=6706 RepID=A0A8J5N016_HOMAM|nr:hypothetical protein Hamer_G024824 [Homarus americanus]